VARDQGELTRLWLAVRTYQLWVRAGHDVVGACEALDGLVAEHGPVAVARAVVDAGLPTAANQPVRPRAIEGVETT